MALKVVAGALESGDTDAEPGEGVDLRTGQGSWGLRWPRSACSGL